MDGSEFYVRLMEKMEISSQGQKSATDISQICRRTLKGEEEAGDGLKSYPRGDLHPSGESARAQPNPNVITAS